MLRLSSHTSANRIRAPSIAAQDAVATNVIGVVMTSSPGPSPRPPYVACKAAVPDVTDTAGAPVTFSSSASNWPTIGPVVSQSPRSTSVTAAMSSSTIDWRP